MGRGRVVALLALGCALAAAAASSGPYLVADRTVRPFRVAVRNQRIRRPERLDGEVPALDRVASALSMVLAAIVIAVAVAVVLIGLWQLGRAVRRLIELRLARSVGRVTTGAYDDDVVTDDSEEVLRRRVADELAALSADLEDLADPREAVIACYLRMERALAEAGSPRHPAESPLELLARVLGEQDVPEPDVRRLTELFSEARFSDHPVTDDMRAAARRSLAGIADALAVPA